jgi:multiple sugar transport system permease protein
LNYQSKVSAPLAGTSKLEKMPDAAAPRRPRRLPRLTRKAAPYLFLAPYFVLFAIFGLFPLLFSIYLSFHQWNPVEGLGAMKFVGIENFRLALTDPWMWTALKNTIVMGLMAGIAQHLVAIPAACFLVSLGTRLRHWLTSAYFLPYITSSIAVSLIFFHMYSPTAGIINQTLIELSKSSLVGWLFAWVPGVMPLRWLEDVDLIKPAVSFVIFWKFTGFNVVLYTTGLMTVPKDLYEAARIDGAGPFRRFWSISLPMLRPFIFFAVTLTLIGQLQLFEEPYVLTRGQGGPSQSALTITAYLMRIGWEWYDMGTASALAWLLFLLIVTLTGLKFLVFGKKGLGDEL